MSSEQKSFLRFTAEISVLCVFNWLPSSCMHQLCCQWWLNNQTVVCFAKSWCMKKIEGAKQPNMFLARFSQTALGIFFLFLEKGIMWWCRCMYACIQCASQVQGNSFHGEEGAYFSAIGYWHSAFVSIISPYWFDANFTIQGNNNIWNQIQFPMNFTGMRRQVLEVNSGTPFQFP